VCVQHQVIKPFCSLENVSFCNLQEEKTEKKNVETMEKKPIFIFTDRILLLFCSASSVCKVDIKLYIVSFLERSTCEFTGENASV
jgi:hypothetical protein